MSRRRVIHILHHSPSVIQDAPLPALLARSGWHLETAYRQQQYIPDLELECWTIERRLKTEITQDFRGITHRVFPARSLGYLREWAPGVMRRLETLPHDSGLTIFLHGTIGILPTQLLMRFGERVRVLVQNHGERPTARMYANGRKKPVDYLLRSALEKRSLRRAARILYLNPSGLEDYTSVGVDTGRLVLSTMGVAVETFCPDDALRRGQREAMGLGHDEQPCIGFVGRLAREKRVDLLLRAFALLPGETRLLVVGDGPERAKLDALVEELQLGARVRFVGHVAEAAALNPLYNAMDLLVLPSSQEGMPVVVVEAMAAGTPVLATDLPGTRMVLGDRDAYGCITSADEPDALAQAIARALQTRFEREKLVARAREYSWRSVCTRHEGLLGV